ncbi:hypothetical protein ACPOL_0769 [Acidisarcina polymorpha]|uniref:Uncharacterized protein n=1 Tax=Acidisarcina polymorpha TaxID=2211140 RepID=A0A2Z5FTJ4_9BACT|nr:hypothetical protein [Acidisarcina polymorpha]AXC10130.1 hypothetical protein ACPOL_0769 [Acidisarcina polymorpha]
MLSPRSLSYARLGLQSLLLHCLDLLEVTLITDTFEDQDLLAHTVNELSNPRAHRIRIVAKDELADLESTTFARYANLRSFRQGHPCWRKITDPLLLSQPGEEMIILDPDLFFPNPFRFEPGRAQGLSLMWQQPNCLLPPEVVQLAMRSGIRLARHVDIGVAHWRASAELDWVDWMLGKLGGQGLPQVMHVEAIVWAAIAMREGGGYLDPRYWKCWQRTSTKRIMLKLGFSGKRLLAAEPWTSLKCFHAGGEAKWWLPAMERNSSMPEQTEVGMTRPFIELTAERYAREEAIKRFVRRVDRFQILR